MTPEDAQQASRMRRLLLALEAQDCAQPRIASAAALATMLEAQLEVLLLEDDELRAAAALPIMREISRGSATSRELSTTALERALRAISQTAESGFRATVGDGEGQFRVQRGPRHATLVEAAEEVDLLLLPGRRGLLRFRVLPTPRVCAICRNSPSGERTLAFAVRLAQQTARPLALVLAGKVPQADLQTSQQRRDFPEGTPIEQLLAATDTSPGNILLVARDVAMAGGHALAEQLASLRCEVLLVG